MQPPHLEMAAIAELRDIMEDEFNSLIDLFVNDSLARVEAVREAVTSGDADAVRRAAHAFKGASSNIGALRLAALCKSLEDKAVSAELDDVLVLVEAIVTERDRVVGMLESERV